MDGFDALHATRRQLLRGLALASATPSLARGPAPVRAIAFDAFVLFSNRAVVDRAAEMVPDANAFVASASSKLFAYTWYSTSAGRYRT